VGQVSGNVREEISTSMVVTYDDDGKVRRIESFHSREEALEAAGLSE
jgi:hypothetical protein